MPALPQSGGGTGSRAGSVTSGAPPRAPNASATQSAAKGKKAKAKKAADPSETEKLLAAKISQLELDQAGEKDQEQEIEREVRKATRDLNTLLAGMGTPLERMEALQKRIADLMGDMKRVEREYAKSKKRADQLQKERDAQRLELNKATGMKDKLEKLAREMTKENKKLKDDNKRLEDSERRARDTTNSQDEIFLNHHNAIMDFHRKATALKGEGDFDEMFRHKFESFFDQYNLREAHFMSVIKAKDHEIQHYVARLENQKKLVDNETTRARQLTTQVSTFSQTETELRSQLNIYVEKFKQVEDTLNNSNDLFLTFRKEMEEMSKKTKRLEKENLNLTRKQEQTNRNVLEMVEERTQMEKNLKGARHKAATLEKIIRGMQEQGRQASLPVDDDGTESEYDSEAVEPGSDEPEYDEETEDELPQSHSDPQTARKLDEVRRKSTKNGAHLANGAGPGSRQVEV